MTDQKSGLNQRGSGTLLARLIVCLLPALVNAKYAAMSSRRVSDVRWIALADGSSKLAALKCGITGVCHIGQRNERVALSATVGHATHANQNSPEVAVVRYKHSGFRVAGMLAP